MVQKGDEKMIDSMFNVVSGMTGNTFGASTVVLNAKKKKKCKKKKR